MKLALVGTLVSVIPLIGFFLFAVVFSFGGESSFPVFIYASASAAYGLLLSTIIKRHSSSPIHVNYLLCTWVFIVLALFNFFGVSAIKFSWLLSAGIVLVGFALAFILQLKLNRPQNHA